MSGATNFQITISALDKATATLRAIKANVRTEFSSIKGSIASTIAPATDVMASLSNLSKEAGLTTLAQHAVHAGGEMVHLGEKITRHVLGALKDVLFLSPAIAALGAGLGIAGLAEWAKTASERYAQLAAGATKTGVAIGSLARLHYAGRQNEVEVESLDKALERLNRTVAKIYVHKGDKTLLSALHAAHVDVWADHVHRKAKSTEQIFLDLAEAVKRNPTNRPFIDTITQAMGTRNAAELLPLLSLGADKIRELGDRFDKLHGPVTDAQGLIGKQAKEAWGDLNTATEGLSDQIGISLAPSITKLISPLTEWIANNRDLVAQKVGGWAKDAADGITKFFDHLKTPEGQKELHTALHEVKDDLRAVADAARGMIDVLKWVHDNWSWVSGIIRAGEAVVTLGASEQYHRAYDEYQKSREKDDIPPRAELLPGVADLFPRRLAASSNGGAAADYLLNDDQYSQFRPITGRGAASSATDDLSLLSQPLASRAASNGNGVGPVDGTVNVLLDFQNMPPGVKARAISTGNNPPSIELNTGHSWAN